MFFFIFLLGIWSSSAFRPENCGMPGTVDSRVKSIIGGLPTPSHVLPFVVATYNTEKSWKKPTTLKYSISDRTHCTGSLISETHVLTAAHCFTFIRCRFIPKQYYVCVGASRNEYCPENDLYRVQKIDLIEKYFESECKHNDLALLTLERKVENAVPICLPIPENGPLSYNTNSPGRLYIAGYSVNYPEGNKYLKLATIDRLEPCLPEFNTTNKICIRPSKDGSTCGGDSGGPLAEIHNDRFVLVGITSGYKGKPKYGKDCGHPFVQDTYEDVVAHIHDIMRILEFQKTN